MNGLVLADIVIRARVNFRLGLRFTPPAKRPPNGEAGARGDLLDACRFKLPLRPLRQVAHDVAQNWLVRGGAEIGAN